MHVEIHFSFLSAGRDSFASSWARVCHTSRCCSHCSIERNESCNPRETCKPISRGAPMVNLHAGEKKLKTDLCQFPSPQTAYVRRAWPWPPTATTTCNVCVSNPCGGGAIDRYICCVVVAELGDAARNKALPTQLDGAITSEKEVSSARCFIAVVRVSSRRKIFLPRETTHVVSWFIVLAQH